MIPRLLWLALLWLARMFIPGRPPKTKIDVNAPCPACGHPSTEIQIIKRDKQYFIEHRCETCKARWPEDVISSAVVIKAADEP